jgi:hypothetical protein
MLLHKKWLEAKTALDSQPQNFDPSSLLQELIETLNEACLPNREYDPRKEERAKMASNDLGSVAYQFLKIGLSFAAESLLLHAYEKFGQIQLETKKRIYRAGLAYHLAQVHMRLGDKGAALRWALHTQADDMLAKHGSGGGAGKQMLRTMLRMSESAFGEFNTVAEQNRLTLEQDFNSDWSVPSGFVEDVIRRFALEKREFAHLFAVDTSVNEFPLSRSYLASLRNRVDASDHSNTTAKGKALENLASYLFLLIPGLVPRRNVLDERQAYETDLIIRNLDFAGNLAAELLGRHFIVECKNHGTTVGVQEVGYFLYRMKLTHARFGVVFATNDISGANLSSDDERAAYQLLRKAFHEDGSVCVVISEKDLALLQDGKITFWSILLEKIERLRFGRQKST